MVKIEMTFHDALQAETALLDKIRELRKDANKYGGFASTFNSFADDLQRIADSLADSIAKEES